MKRGSILQDKLDPPRLGLDENLDDQELFRKAMVEVRRLRSRRRVCKDGQGIPHWGQRPGKEETEFGSMEETLEQFLKCHGEPDCRVGYVEGGARKWDRLLLRKLRNGGFSVQGELDLHGLDQKEAQERMEKFIGQCTRQQLTCVRIVHGKGKNSPHHVPVLKPQIQRWLSFKRLSRFVVAYTSARPVDGGVGAIYLLLQRRKSVGGKAPAHRAGLQL